MKLLSSQIAGLLADSVNDADSTRKVYLLAAGLAGLGIALIAITVWFWRNTRHDPELLAPLEAMGERAFVKLDSKARQQILDAARPPDAEPMRWGVIRGETDLAQEIVDLRATHRAADAGGYDDLRDEVAAVESPVSAVVPIESPAIESARVVEAVAEASDDSANDSASSGSASSGSASRGSGSGGSASSGSAISGSGLDSPDPSFVDEATTPRAPDDQSVPDTNAESKLDSTAETVLDEFAIIDSVRVAPIEPIAQNAPLLIVPVDHELRVTTARSPSRTADRPGSAAPDRASPPDRTQAPESAEPVMPETAVKPSIDPLLRKFDRDDS